MMVVSTEAVIRNRTDFQRLLYLAFEEHLKVIALICARLISSRHGEDANCQHDSCCAAAAAEEHDAGMVVELMLMVSEVSDRSL